MRESIKQFVSVIFETLPVKEPIFEFGALQVQGQVGFADLRYLFPGKEYLGCDIREGPGVDRILNLHSVDLASESAGSVLILDTLEHVEFCRKALEEVHRILKPSGLVVISSVLNFPIHDFPCDYWRFTPEGFRSLLRPFSFSFVESVGRTDFPHTIVGVGCKGKIPDDLVDRLFGRISEWKLYWSNPPRASRPWKDLIKPFIPPIALNLLYRRIRTR